MSRSIRSLLNGPTLQWAASALLLCTVGLQVVHAQEPGVEEFEHELERTRTGRHANFSKAVSLLSNAYKNDAENEELKTYLIRALAADGASLFVAGDLEGALIRFRRSISYEPSPEAAHLVLADLDPQVQLDMLVRGGEYRAIVREFDELRKEDDNRPSIEDSELQENARNLVQEMLRSNNPERRWELVQEILAMGELSVPHLLPWLANERDDQARSYAIATLNRMRGDAVLPIIRAMDSSSEFQRLNVAIVLGNIGDPRGLAALQRAVESREESGRVKQEAGKAVSSILAGAAPSSAREYYWRKALDYYSDKESVLRSFDDNWIVWRWDTTLEVNGNVSGEDVPRYAYNERLAEDALIDLLALSMDDAGRRAALALLVASYISQYQEARGVANLAEDQGAPDFESVEQAAMALEQAIVLAQAGGPDLLGDVILRSVADGDGPVAIGAIDALVAIRGDVSALSPALKASDKRVRYRAAVAALELNPSGAPFANSGDVVPSLVDALGEVGARAVLVIEENTSIRNTIISQGREARLNTFGAASGLAGLARATQYPKPDVIFISDGLSDIDPRTVARRLKDDYRTAGTPIAILSDLDKVGLNEADFVSTGLAQRVIAKQTNSSLLGEQVEFLLSEAERMDSGRRAANEAAQAAAEALAMLDPASTGYPVQQAVPGLLSSVETHGDEVRIPSLHALRKFGDESAIRVVRACLTDMDASVEARSAAAATLGALYKKKGQISDEIVDMLTAIVADTMEPVMLRKAAGAALGEAPLTPQQRIELMTGTLLHPKR